MILAVLFFGIIGVVLFRVLASEKPHTVLLKWNPSVPKPGVTVAGYNIYRSKPDGSFGPLATGIVPPTYLDTKVSQGTTYYYYVTATNSSGTISDATTFPAPGATFSGGSASVNGTLTGSNTLTSNNTSGQAHPILMPVSLMTKIIKT